MTNAFFFLNEQIGIEKLGKCDLHYMLNLFKYHKLDKHQRMNTDHVASGQDILEEDL